MSGIPTSDYFCGGGGSSTGLWLTGQFDIDSGYNHSKLATEVHALNHPGAEHYVVDLHLEDPRRTRRTPFAWFSPECTKWSRAAGAKYAHVPIDGGDLLDLLDPELVEPVEADIAQRSRLLMFDVLRFVEHHTYDMFVVENVPEIATHPKYRLAWQAWRKGVENLGYEFVVVHLNSMHAQLLGLPAPQSRNRIYVLAWRKGMRAPEWRRLVRPQAYCPTCDVTAESMQRWRKDRNAGSYKQQYDYVHSCGTIVEPGWLPAAAAIDWAIPGARIGDRKTALAEKTRMRLAAGIARHWGPIHLEAGGNQYDAADPKHPQHADPNAYYRTWPITEVLRTQSTSATKAVAVPPLHVSLMGTHQYAINNSASPVDRELRTLTAEGNNDYLLTPYYGNATGCQPVTDPIGTLTTKDRYALVTRHNGSKDRPGAEMTTPIWETLRTLTTTAQQSIITPGDIKAAEAQIDDCLYRMLQPHEVAAGMAFPDDYDWGKANKSQRVRLAGNAVTPPAARDIGVVVAEALGGAAA